MTTQHQGPLIKILGILGESDGNVSDSDRADRKQQTIANKIKDLLYIFKMRHYAG